MCRRKSAASQEGEAHVWKLQISILTDCGNALLCSKADTTATILQTEQKYLIDAGGFCEVDGLPAIDKGSEGEVHVLNCGSALPAANSDDGLATPDSSCSIEVEEAPSRKLDILFTFAVEVQ